MDFDSSSIIEEISERKGTNAFFRGQGAVESQLPNTLFLTVHNTKLVAKPLIFDCATYNRRGCVQLMIAALEAIPWRPAFGLRKRRTMKT